MTITTAVQFDAYEQAVAKLGRQPRAGQQELVAKGTNLEEGSRLLVRAPTATGKSLAALMIAGFRWERNDGNRTVIATYTKLLQDQYSRTSTDPQLQTDLDQARLLFPGMSFAVLKGAGNYLCRKIAAGYVRPGRVDGYSELAEGTGDPGELKDFTGGPVWKAKAEPKKCREHSADECGFMAAKDRARKANCVVTNHALVVLNASNPAILGEHSLLIIDEVHNLSKAAESMATVTLDLTEMVIEAENSTEGNGPLEAEVLRLAQRSINQGDIWNDRIPSVEELQRLAQISKLEVNNDLYRWVTSAAKHYQDRDSTGYLATVAKKNRFDAEGKRVLKLGVIDIGRVTSRALRTTVDIDDETSFDRAVLMMSATVGTPTRPAYVADRCGVETELLQVTSALDYKAQMQVSLLDLPSGWDFAQAVTQLCKETGGRTLVLCRSWKMVNAVRDYLFNEDLPFRVFIQDQEYSSNNGGVVAQFKADETSVLIGTASFFEGIDIPGASLSQVVITQLPMLMTMSPLEEERKRRLGSRFIPDSQVPHTALVLEQMMGRLIRSTSDRGVCVVLDPRAQTGWGATAVKHAVEAFGSPCVSRRDALAWLEKEHTV